MVAEIVDERLWRAKALREEHQYEQALALILEVLDDDPENPQALFQAGGLFILLDKKGLAHNLMARCLKFAPDSPEAWINYGRTLADTPEGWEESEQCFFRALEMNPQSRAAYENLGALELGRCNPAKSIAYCLKALELDAQSRVAISTLGFAQLMDGDWQNGWKNYHTMLGHRSRPLIQYGDLPEWDGSPGKSVIVNGEQGIGDEILYASMIADMAKDCRYVIYDGMERLNGLMRRSLPDNVIVAGSRWKDELELPADINPDARITQAGVGMFYRKRDEDFPGTPYLRADPQAGSAPYVPFWTRWGRIRRSGLHGRGARNSAASISGSARWRNSPVCCARTAFTGSASNTTIAAPRLPPSTKSAASGYMNCRGLRASRNTT